VDTIYCFTLSEVTCAVNNLKKSTSPGKDCLSSEHFIYAHDHICNLLTILFNSMLSHNHIPGKFMDTVIVPLLKDKKGDISDVDNYRPIALTCVFSKIFESVLLEKYRHFLTTSHNQFGFKAKHSTDQCIFILKELIDYFTTPQRPLYICFMDASKAFDKVNHFILFDKLLKRGLPVIIVRLICTWYTTQRFFVKWCECLSDPFTVSNGVRQGGILSPLLFNVFIDDLSVNLANTKVGCFIESVCFNHLFYADDSVLVAPSPSALQKLIRVCEAYGIDNDMTFNPNKTVCMAFLPKIFLFLPIPSMYMNGNVLKWVEEHKYLGFIMTSNKSDKKDINRQLRYIYARGNILFRNFYHCHADTKLLLFKSYCYNLYCCQLWTHYSQQHFNKVKVAYNNVFRHLFNIKKRCSMSQLYMYNDIDSFSVLMRKSIVRFRQRLKSSDNLLIKGVLILPYFYNFSHMHRTWSKFIF
jgi:hypothetical protein